MSSTKILSGIVAFWLVLILFIVVYEFSDFPSMIVDIDNFNQSISNLQEIEEGTTTGLGTVKAYGGVYWGMVNPIDAPSYNKEIVLVMGTIFLVLSITILYIILRLFRGGG